MCLKCCDNRTIGCYERCCAAPALPLADVAGSLHTGDVVLMRASPEGRFAGQYSIASSPYDHSGIIYVREGEVWVLDSGSFRYGPYCIRPLDFDASSPAESWSSAGSGPQMYRLQDLISAQEKGPFDPPPKEDGTARPRWYYEKVCVRRLNKPLSEDETSRLEAFVRQVRDNPYEKDGSQMTSAAIDICDCCGCCSNTEEDESSLFCSELTAASYKAAGLLPPDLPSSEYVPSDFTRFHACNLCFVTGCCWLSWLWRRCCTCGDLRAPRARGGGRRLFGPEIVIDIPIPEPSK